MPSSDILLKPHNFNTVTKVCKAYVNTLYNILFSP